MKRVEKNGMVGAWHGHGMASVNQTRPQSVNQIGKTHSKPLAARQWQGNGMLCVNRPLKNYDKCRAKYSALNERVQLLPAGLIYLSKHLQFTFLGLFLHNIPLYSSIFLVFTPERHSHSVIKSDFCTRLVSSRTVYLFKS